MWGLWFHDVNRWNICCDLGPWVSWPRISQGLKDVERTNLADCMLNWSSTSLPCQGERKVLNISWSQVSSWQSMTGSFLSGTRLFCLSYFTPWYLLLLTSLTYWNTHQSCHRQQNCTVLSIQGLYLLLRSLDTAAWRKGQLRRQWSQTCLCTLSEVRWSATLTVDSGRLCRWV